MKTLLLSLIAVSATAQVLPTTQTLYARQAVNTGGAVDAWQAPATQFAYYTFTAAGSWSASISGISAVITPSSGTAGAQTIRVAMDNFLSAGTSTGTITVTGTGGGTATLVVSTRPQQPFANFGSAPADCTNPRSTLYPGPVVCNGASGGTLLAAGVKLAYASKHAECGGMLMVRQTTSPFTTRIISGSTGATLYDSLPGSDENNNWDVASGCAAFFYLSGLTIQRYVIATGVSTPVWNAPAGHDLLSDGGPHPVSADGWYAVMVRPTGAGATAFHTVCAIQTIGLTTANQNSQTWCISMASGLDGNPAPTLVDSPGVTPPDRLGRRYFEIGATGGSYFCDFSTTTGITNCRRWEWYRSTSNNEDGVCSTSEVCWPTAHSDYFVLDGEPCMAWPYEDFRAIWAYSCFGKGTKALRPFEEGGGTGLWASIRADGRTGTAGSEYGCQDHLCWFTSYSSGVGEHTQPANMQVQAIDLRDRSLHVLVSDTMMRTPASFSYSEIPQANMSRDGCWLYYAGSGAGGNAAVNLYRKATNLCRADPPMRERAGLSIKANATKAVISYTAPSTAACTVAVSAAPFPMAHVSSLHADTSTPASDSRTGSISVGRNRQFVVGNVSALSPSTQYAARVDCGSWAYVLPFVTRAAGAGGSQISLPTSTAAEVSSSADMSSPTSLSAATTHTVAVPTGEVRYFRAAGGAIQVVL
jgi:hypothetical protein